MKRAAALGATLVSGLLASLLLWFKVRYGGPTVAFPDRSTTPLIAGSPLEVVATLEEAPGNIAVSGDGRVFFNFHPEGRPSLKVAELVDGGPVAWPGPEWQRPRGKGEPFFDCVFSVRIDRQGRLWTVDHGFHGLRQPRLLAFDLATRRLVHRWDIPKALAGIGSYVQDFQVSPDGKWVYLADVSAMAGKPALLAYDVDHGTGRRLLEREPSTTGKPYTIDAKGHPMRLLGGLYVMHPGLDSIALDVSGEWLFFGPMSHETLFRVRTADLRDPALPPAELSLRVEPWAPKPQSDGLSTDREGNVYLTDVEHGAIAIVGPDRGLRTLTRDPRLRWPDGLGFGPGDWLYVADSDIPDIMMRTKEHIRRSAPFFLFRFRTGHEGVPGR